MKLTVEAFHIYFRVGYVLLEQILDYYEEKQLSARVYLGYKVVYQSFTEKDYKYITVRQTTGIATLFRYLGKRGKLDVMIKAFLLNIKRGLKMQFIIVGV